VPDLSWPPALFPECAKATAEPPPLAHPRRTRAGSLMRDIRHTIPRNAPWRRVDALEQVRP